MEKTAYAAIRMNKETGKEVFLVTEIGLDWEHVEYLAKNNDKVTGSFKDAYPVIRIAQVLITVID